ncbi:hypothetical protein N7530_001832 [Penicillium desertorum]|jgi:hypothetical protein|uniref:Uncharacterized protein n=1 Tax=Penicillium desertorum TaxID=1303715 RepID=A0A9X0BWZ3_9EURO|nr:hypothetical protein N7530_001832 [Penicillium desertorum]
MHNAMLCGTVDREDFQLSWLARHAYNKQSPFERWNENADVEADVRKKQYQMRGRCVKQFKVA